MTIQRRLALSFISILALFAVNVSVYFWGNSQLKATIDGLRSAVSRQLLIVNIKQKIGDIRKQVALLNQDTSTSSREGLSSILLQRYVQPVEEAGDAIRQLKEQTGANGAVLDAFQAKYNSLATTWRLFYQSFGKDQATAITNQVEAEKLADDVSNRLAQLDKEEKRQLDGALQQFRAVAFFTDRITIALFLTSSLLGIAVAFLLSRYVGRGMEDLERGAAAIGQGDLAYRINVRSGDEIGKVGDTFNQMAENLNTARAQLVEANRELEQRHHDLYKRDRELQDVNAQLIESERRSQAANQAKSEFLAKMSHELRTPLNAIIGYSEMLQEEAEDTGQGAFVPDLKKIRTAGKHLLALINDILDLSKIEAGKMELFLENFDIHAMIRDVATTLQPMVEKNANTLEVQCASDIGAMYADLTKVRQGLFNLLSNANKFTERGQVTVAVENETLDGREWVRIAVTDTGIGIAPDQLSKLFQEFSQADASTTRRYGGTGLGLVITRRFCQMMGGDVTVKSEANAGSTFTIHLPKEVEAPITDTAEDREIPIEAVVSDPAGKEVVLVVDDDTTMHDLMRRFLTKEGYHVVCASSGEEGLKLAATLQPAIITLDVMMPVMDGWTVLTRLKSDPKLADIPVIVLTMVDDRNVGYALGASDYMTKPIERERLVTVLRKYRQGPDGRPILIVEDDPATRELMRRLLEKEGWQVTEAENGREGLDRLAGEQPDLILLDLMMPEMDGFEFLAELRANAEWRKIPVIVVTAKELTEEDRSRLSGHVGKIVQKGAYSREDLLREIREMIRMSGRRSRHVEPAAAPV